MFEDQLKNLETELGIEVPKAIKDVLASRYPDASREQLLQQITNGQTYFFRHPDQCDAFERYLAKSDPLSHWRIWSAGSSTGCEAYTIAIILDRVRRAGTVLGSDIAQERLAEARAGVYRESRLQRITLSERDSYFLPAGAGKWRVHPRLTAGVRFETENLTLTDGPGMSRLWDVIFCRNVLIYFDESTARHILSSLVQRMELGGLLVLGFPEAFFGLQHPELKLLTSRSAIFTKVAVKLPSVTSSPEALPQTAGPWAEPGPFQKALRLHAAGRLKEAETYLDEAAAQTPDFALIHYFAARLQDELGQPQRAVESLQRYFETYEPEAPELLDFTERNGLTLGQLNLAAQRLRERISKGRV